MLLAFAIWTARIPGPSFWVDEWFTAEIARAPTVAAVWRTVAERERRPPLHHLLIQGWLRVGLAGQSDFALRFPSAAAGALAVAVTLRLGRDWLGRRAAAWSGAPVALSPFLALYAPMARYYSLAWLLVGLSWLAFDRWRRGRGPWWALPATLAALAYTDPAILSVVAGQAFLLFLLPAKRSSFPPPRRRGWLLAVALAAVAFLPWILPLAGQASRDLIRADFAGGPAGWELRTLAPGYIWAVGEAALPWRPLAWPGLLSAAALTLLALRQRRARAVLALGVGLPLLLTALLIGGVAPDITFLNVASRALYAAPALYLAWGAALAGPDGSHRTRRAVLLAALVLTDLWGLNNLRAGRDLLNPIYAVPAREIAALVATAAARGDVFLADGDTVVARYWPDPAPIPLLDSGADEAAALPGQRPPRVWLLAFGRDRTREREPVRVLAALDRDYSPVQSWGFAPVDPLYQQLKAWLLGRPAYAYKATLTLYQVNHALHP
ncbi:MAG: glycosyltransferase family 39 protein [Chloroflexi bacterium]|nr:glycosyltransferase family 39 protein [Chloroflexota bacterium]